MPLLYIRPFFVTLSVMTRLGDVLYFLRQIFFPNWKDPADNDSGDAEPTGRRKILAGLLLFLISKDGTGTMFSIILHVFILVILALNTFSLPGSIAGIDILVGSFNLPGEESVPVVIPPTKGDEPADNGEPHVDTASQQPTPQEHTGADTLPTTAATDVEPVNPNAPGDPLQIRVRGGFAPGGGFDKRTPTGQQQAMQRGDISAGGEAAVEMALDWLVAHRNRNDGGWSLLFDDSCSCRNPGTNPSRTAATALALLPFLGAGYSYDNNSRYKSVVEEGLFFLIHNANGGFDGAAIQTDPVQMYSYGLASIALCEAFAMNREQDPTSTLGRAAQKSLRFIEYAQDPVFGGWNYRREQIYRREDGQNIRIGGDTSIFAWQLMALKSGKIGGLNVSQSTLYAAQDFLDSVTVEGGRRYNYIVTGNWDGDPERRIDSPKTCTAIGLLMRMYLGWKPGDPFLDDGMAQLVRWGYKPDADRCNLYYVYYATLALHHYGGEHWETWNSGLQEFLIREQVKQGCEAGSWHFPNSYCDVGGRLLNTSLAVMILETPYRIMPLYREIR
jgi:hypothetical protein